MSRDIITLTFRQKALLIRAIEEQITDLRSKASNSGLLTRKHLDEYEVLLDVITHGHAYQVETPSPEETA